MNTSTDDFENSDLRRQITEALLPDPLSDGQIDRLQTEQFAPLDERQTARVLAHTQSLLQQNPHDLRAVARRTNPRKVEVTMQRMERPSQHRRNPRGAVAALAVSMLALLGAVFWSSQESYRQEALHAAAARARARALDEIRAAWMTPEGPNSGVAANAATVVRVAVGQQIETAARERRRVTLPDGSVLYVNERTRVTVATPRRLEVEQGEVFVEVVPQFDEQQQKERFQVKTPTRTITALGTRFGVDTASEASVMVTQGRVEVSGVEGVLESGQALRSAGHGAATEPHITTAMRSSERLSWTRELRNAAVGGWVPASEHAGGSIITVDPAGQEMKLSLRKYHVDVHIEDGFARTTIDQTYFNHTQSRLEGTFHFPLPPDASLSRLAMYVNGKLMEGGMAERQHARNTFEQIVHKMKDPALLEWVDGTTFKMRVFPLEARQEKRIVLSYTQRLDTAYGRSTYRFPAGHSMDRVGQWSTAIRVAGGRQQQWTSPTHSLTSHSQQGDLVLTAEKKHAAMDKDLVLELRETEAARPARTLWTSAEHAGQTYLLLRHRPELPAKRKRPPRNWIVLFETAADRNPLLAGTQVEVVRTLLNNAEHDDTFSILTANTQGGWLHPEPRRCTASSIRTALNQLQQTHLIGALNLEHALAQVGDRVQTEQNGTAVENLIVHLGSAIPVLGEQDQGELLRLLPDDAAYVGVGVGKNWSRPFMKAAAGRTGGYLTQINPDNEVAWRAFELSSLLNSPRLLDVSVASTAEARTPWLRYAETIVQGEEICAVTRLAPGQSLPDRVTVSGQLNGKAWKKTLRVDNVQQQADYLPRSWTRLEIDRLLADSGAEHRSEIIRLSKSMYVMSPYTSLLVLENEQMYTQYNVDRGRDDHWALYGCPAEIKVVHEPLIGPATVADAVGAQSGVDSLRQLGRLAPPVSPTTHTIYLSDGYRVDHLYGLPANAGSMPIDVNGNGTVFYSWPAYYDASGFDVSQLNSLDLLSLDASALSDVELTLSAVPMQANGTVNFVAPNLSYSVPTSGVVPVIDESVRFAYPLTVAGQPYLGPFYPYSGAQLGLSSTRLSVLNTTPSILFGRQEQPLGFSVQQMDGEGIPWQFSGRTPLDWGKAQLSWDDSNWYVDWDADGWQRDLSRPQVQQLMELEAKLEAIVPSLDEQNSRQLFDLRRVQVERLVEQQAQLQEQAVREELAAAYIRLPELRQQQLSGLSSAFRYQGIGGRPIVAIDPVLTGSLSWRDLMSFAPALNTTHADRMAVAAEQAQSDDTGDSSKSQPEKRGKVDPAARRLIEQARSGGFEQVTLQSEGKTLLRIVCDATGRHACETRSPLGLVQKTFCDGTSIRHAYPQLGLSARRSFSEFHFGQLQTLLPWLVRSVADLSRDADLKLVDDHVVAIMPHARAAEETKRKVVHVHLVFADDGRLSERRVVDPESGRALVVVRFEDDGRVVIQHDDRTEELPLTWSREPADAPQPEGTKDELVELPMPIRSVAFVDEQISQVDGEPGERLQLARILALLSEGRTAEARDVLRTEFLEAGDQRDGLFVLLSRIPQDMVWSEDVPGAQGRKREVDLRPSPEGSVLKQFVRQHLEMWKSGPAVFDLEQNDDGFVARLARAHNIFVRWKTGQATESRTEAQISSELQTALAAIADLPPDERTWSLLAGIQQQLTTAGQRELLATALKAFADSSVLSQVAAQERARLLFQTDRPKKARKIYRELLLTAASDGRPPVIDENMRELFVADGGQAAWQKTVSACGRQLLKGQRLRAAFDLSVRLRALGDTDEAAALLDQLLAVLPAERRPGIAVLAIEQLRQLKDGRAEELMGQVLHVQGLSEDPQLWRYASLVADDLGHKQEALLRMEHAVWLEYEQGVKFVDVQKLRETYQGLMQRFGEVIDAAATLQTRVPDDLYARLIRAADQWRSLDSDTTTCCHTTARLLTKLKRSEEAWQYLTTPLAGRSGEAAPWRTLAKTLADQKDVDLADMAYARAFEFERTNPEILLEHALFLKNENRRAASTRLLKQIVDTSWQPRFAAIQQQARGLLP